MKKEVEVVGTFYTDAEKILRNIAKDNGEPWNANGYNFHELKLTLTPEPENEHDPNAIAVYSNYPTPEKARIKRSGRVGYLPRGTGIVLNEPVEVSATVKEGFKRFYISIDISDFLPPEKEKREIQLTTNDMNFLKKYFEDTKPVEKKEKIKMEKIFTIKKPGKTIITITGETITISRKGTLNMMNHGLKGDKTIPISNIIAIQVKKPNVKSVKCFASKAKMIANVKTFEISQTLILKNMTNYLIWVVSAVGIWKFMTTFLSQKLSTANIVTSSPETTATVVILKSLVTRAK